MRAYVITGPGRGGVEEVPEPHAGPGEVIVDVARVGLCGTDVEFWTGEMSYLETGYASYPLRLGHEWSGTVSAVGDGVDSAWIGRRTTGDTMLSCGRCARCLSGRHHVCADHAELGVGGGWPGALAEQLLVPVASLHPLPSSVDDVAGAMVEPGGNALRALWASDLALGERVLILGAGAIGLLVAEFARADGREAHLLGRSRRSQDFARSLGFPDVWERETLPDLAWDSVIDASNSAEMPALAVELVEPGRRVVYLGLSGTPSLIDTRAAVLKDVTAVGILGASHGLDGTIEQFASGDVDASRLIAATVPLSRVGDVLSGWRPEGAGPGPKIQVDPRS